MAAQTRPSRRIRIASVLLPDRLIYGNHLTPSARRLLLRFAVGLLGLAVACAGVGLLNSENWPDVFAGALFAWSTSFVVWSVASYRSGSSDTEAEIYRMAENDLVHARLNLISRHLGLPVVDLNAEIESVLSARRERLAHFSGLDEFRGDVDPAGAKFWTAEALGMHD